jgi:undecaprenyl-diphosphatase
VLLGGVLASQHRIPLAAALAAAIAGAVGGDAIGYAVGKRWGRGLLHGTLGRLVKDQHLQRGERYLAERGGRAVFFGRFTAALRVVVPGLAGMAGMPYRTFAVYNIIGGAAWASETTLVGDLAGASWRRAEHLASRIGLLLLVLLLLGIGVSVLARALRRRTYSLQAIGDRLATTRPATWRWSGWRDPMGRRGRWRE